MKMLWNICLLVLFSNCISACGYEKNKPENDIKLEGKVTLSSEDRSLIEEYNEVGEYLLNGNEKKFREELKLFLPKAFQIENDKERNNILMNIYMQTKMYPEALELNSSLIKNYPNNVNARKFQCLLLKTLNESDSKIKNCYVTLSTILKNNLDILKSDDPMYVYTEWAYFSAMFHAGNSEYQEKLKSIVSTQKDTDSKFQFETMYDAEISNQILPK